MIQLLLSDPWFCNFPHVSLLEKPIILTGSLGELCIWFTVGEPVVTSAFFIPPQEKAHNW